MQARSIFTLFILINSYSSSDQNRDFYKILGVSKSTSVKDIKTAYRKLAKELHPDKNRKDPLAERKFQDLGYAYEILTNEKKRKIYDRYGEKGLNEDKRRGGGGPNAQNGFRGPFGGRQGQQRERPKPKGHTIKMPLDITLEEAYNGETIQFTRYKKSPKTIPGTRKCNCRQETETISMGNGRFRMVPKIKCDECPNVVLEYEETEFEFDIEPGIDTKSTQNQGSGSGYWKTWTGEGEPEIDGDPGNLQMKINILPHKIFQRIGNDLYCNMTISLLESLIGFSTTINHLDGRVLGIKRDEITWPGMKMKIKYEGMIDWRYKPVRHGDLFITFDVSYPRNERFDVGRKEEIRKILSLVTGGEDSDQNGKRKESVYNGLYGILG